MRVRDAEIQKATRNKHVQKNEWAMQRRARAREKHARAAEMAAAADEVVEEEAPEGESIHNRRYTAEQEATAVEAMRAGAKLRPLAREMGVSYRIICFWKRKHGIGQSYTTEEKKRVVDAMLQGAEPKMLAEETGISYSTLCRWRIDAGYLSPRAAAMKRKAEERRLRVEAVDREMKAEKPTGRPPKKPKPQADRLTKYCYLMDVVNYNRKQEGLKMIQYGELQTHFDKYLQWMPEDWEKWVK